MTNREISDIFSAIGALLQIRGDDAFRARIYERAADIIDKFPRELSGEIAEQDAPGYDAEAVQQLRATPGIGKAIEDKTVEMLKTGRSKYYDNLIAEMGTEILEVLEIRGLGVKTVGKLYQELGVRSLEDLQVLLENGKLNNMKGMGKKTLQMLTESLSFRMELRKARPLRNALQLAGQVVESLTPLITDGWIKQEPEWTGHLRRLEEVCRGIELIVVCKDEAAFQFADGNAPDSLRSFLEPFSEKPIVFKTGDGIAYTYHSDSAAFVETDRTERTDDVRETLPVLQFSVDQEFPVSLYLCTPATYAVTLFLTTATDAHFGALPNGSTLQTTEPEITETEIYKKLGLSYIPPELRQDGTSVAAAQDNALPKLVEFTDLRGDLHAHTDWSDGRQTLQDMVAAAQAEGLEYFAITDHSVSSVVANGLDQGRLLDQVKQVRELNAAVDGITVLAGSEVDIRRYGELDFPDEVLAQLDVVVASVHSNFNLTEAEMTERIIRAIENPFVNIIGHPTGRMLGHRPMYPLNIAAIIEAAAENNTVLEINGSPSRLDLDSRFVRMAKDAGVLLAVNTDAHGIPQLAHRRTGLNVARRGWLTKAEVINTYTLEELREKCGIGKHS
ncbi:PHP domain-containing protein [Candidatus Poribacteria bacterium]|nr:PHP domain-containing protein [Candidatus Poribacteria bacterium]